MSADVNETRLRRGLILHALHAQFPMALTKSSTEKQVGPFYGGDTRSLARDLAYLEESGFLEDRSSEIGDRTVHAYKITPAGMNLVEGATKDPGVHFERG